VGELIPRPWMIFTQQGRKRDIRMTYSSHNRPSFGAVEPVKIDLTLNRVQPVPEIRKVPFSRYADPSLDVLGVIQDDDGRVSVEGFLH
jgi:hypothetical protein